MPQKILRNKPILCFNARFTDLTDDEFFAYEKRSTDKKWPCLKCTETEGNC